MKSILTCLLVVISHQLAAQNRPTLITQKISDNPKFILSGQIGLRSLQLFVNRSNDSMQEKLLLTRPLHVYSTNMLIDQAGKSKNNYFSLILFPGDTVIIDNNKQILSSIGYQSSIDSLLLLKEEDYVPSLNAVKEIQNIGLRRFVATIQNRYALKEKRIDEIAHTLDKQQISTLRSFNYIIRAKNISQIPFDKLKLNADELQLMDSCYKSIKSNVDRFNEMDSNFSLSIYYFLFRYNAYKNEVLKENFWDYAFKLDNEIRESSYYLPYIFLRIENGYSDYKLPEKLLLKIDSIKNKPSTLDTISRVLSALNNSLINFKNAKEELGQISNSKYAYFLSSTRNDQRDLNDLKPSLMTDYQGKQLDFKQGLFNAGQKITVIDFWASWCIPCIQDYPILEEIKQSLKSKPVKFVSISIDKDQDIAKWKAMVDKLNGSNTTNQYRLLDINKKIVSDYFNMITIPRYVVVDEKGKVLAYEFFRPNDIKFKKELDMLIGNLN